MFLNRTKAVLMGCVAALMLVSLSAPGRDWFTREWRSDEGLPDNSVIGVAQSDDGLLWVATQGGLVRFDGVRFQEFSVLNIPGVPNRVIRTVLIDRRKRLWIGVDHQTTIRIENGQARVFGEKDGLLDLLMTAMVEDGEGSIWTAYGPAGVFSRIKDDKVTLFGSQEGVPSGGACTIARDSQGKIWFAKGRHVGVFHNEQFKTLATLEDSVAAITASDSGGIWICAGDRLFKFAEGRRLEEIARLPQSGTVPSTLYQDRAGALWVGTKVKGLFRHFGDGGLKPVRTSHPNIVTLTEDQEGNLWVGTAGGGLNQVRPRLLELMNAEQPFESVRAVCEDAEGTIWTVTQSGLLLRQNGAEWLTVSDAPNWPGGLASTIVADRDGSLWIGLRDRGLYHLKDGRYKIWRRQDGLASISIRALMFSANGDLWLGTDSPRRIQRLRNNKFFAFELPPSTRSIRALAEDRHGNIWAGSAEGQLFRIQGDTLYNETTNLLGKLSTVRAFHMDDEGVLWIGHAGDGLGRIKDGNYLNLTRAHGLPDDDVSQLISDNRGWLWLASTRGMFRVSLQQLNEVAEGRAAKVSPLAFGRDQGLPSLQPNFDNFPGAIRGRDGRLRIAMRTGLAVVRMENLRDNPEPPRILLERIVVDGQTLALYDSKLPLHGTSAAGVPDLRSEKAVKLRLPPRHRKLEFEFTAPGFIGPENMRFRYRLDGLDEDWMDAGTQRQASYSRLAAGDYRFRVIACNDSGVWNETGAVVAFTVLPFFWQTWWFGLAVLALFTGLVIAVVRYVSFRRLRAQLRQLGQQAALHRERARIAKDIHDDLGASLTQVALLSDLTQQDLTEPPKAGAHLKKIASTARQAITALDEIVWAVNPRNDTLPHLVDYLGQFTLDFLRSTGIRCRLDLPENPPAQSIPADIRHNLFLAVKEALNNVVKHAHATEVRLGVDISNGTLRVVVKDDGAGLNGSTPEAGGNGLQNMRHRLSEIGGQCQVESREGGGTTVTFDIPWQRN